MKSLIVTAGLLICAVLVATFGEHLPLGTGEPSIPAKAASPAHPSRTALQTSLREAIEQVRIIDERPSIAGYDRECGTGHGCVFGRGWTDEYDGPAGRNDCPTREDLLAAQLTEVEYRSDTNHCVVLDDPYTAHQTTFTKADAAAVQADHLYPLAAAGDMGASTWTLSKRIRFANDVETNLLAVGSPTNASKGFQLPGRWLPPNRGFRCEYLQRYLMVATTYDLPITAADRNVILATTPPNCGDKPQWKSHS